MEMNTKLLITIGDEIYETTPIVLTEDSDDKIVLEAETTQPKKEKVRIEMVRIEN